MSKRKDKTKIIGSIKLHASRKPYYFQVFLWDDIQSLKDHHEVTDDTLAITCFEPWFVDDETGKVYINPKLGEIHFAKDSWNVNVVAHEVQHAIIHRMRLVWPPAHLILLEEYADAEEEIAYETGHWVERVYRWLGTADPTGLYKKLPLPHYVSKVRFPKSGLKLITRAKPQVADTKEPA
jgi:hypothetical protein